MFEAIVETLPAQLVVIDPQTHDLLYANAAARKMWAEARKGNKQRRCSSETRRTQNQTTRRAHDQQGCKQQAAH